MDFQPNPTLIREIPGVARIEQVGCTARVNGKPAAITTAETVLANPQHYFRKMLPAIVARMERGEVAAIVTVDRSNGPAFAPKNGLSTHYIQITPEEFALGSSERARFAAWQAGVSGRERERQDAERAYDLANNEGGEGYNPHRDGAERSYARAPRRDRHYPQGA